MDGKITNLGVRSRNKSIAELGVDGKDEMASNNNNVKSEELVKEMATQKVRETMQKLQVEIMQQMEQQMNEMMTEVMREVEQTTQSLNHRDSYNNDSKYKNRKKSDKPGALPDKLFHPRNSLLTDLFEVQHIRTIYNIFIVILIILFLNSFIDDILAGNLKLSIDFIQWSFGKFRVAFTIWLAMFVSTCSVYACFNLWANQRARFSAKGFSQQVWDYSWLLGFIVYQIGFIYFPVSQLVYHGLPPATSVALLLEQVRLVMKCHAFVRSNVPRVLGHVKHAGFSHFLYFLFCPTLVYRDQYPRTKQIRWKSVAWNLTEVLGVIFYMSFIFERFLVPSHRDFGLQASTHEHRIVLVFGAILPGMLSFLCGFYCLLHAWMNVGAEITRFADRMFYQDWWNANSYGAYYRRWNVVVHDWLYTYIYKDVCETFCPGNRFIPTMAVFAVSALVHEYILAFTFGFFYPMLMFTFGFFGMSLVFITSDKAKGGNIFMWLCLSTGTGLMTSVYCMEWYARVNCVQTQQDVVLDFLIPRSWTCVPKTTV